VNETKLLVEQHMRNYQERFQEPYPVLWPRDCALASKMLKTQPFAKLTQWNREFIWSDDKQISEGGYSFPQFSYHLSRIITRSSASKTVKLLKGVYYDSEQTRTPIRDAVAFLAVNFQKMDMEAPTTRSYERALKDLANEPEILQQAVELLIDEAANGRPFYPIPKPADLKGACAKVIEVKRLKAFCDAAGVCDHSPKFFEEIEREDGSTVLQRCSHWKIGRAEMEKIAKPLSLPLSPYASVIKEM
jgi:hypothetical protein